MSYNSAWLDGYNYALKEIRDYIDKEEFSDHEINSIINFIEEKRKCHNK